MSFINTLLCGGAVVLLAAGAVFWFFNSRRAERCAAVSFVAAVLWVFVTGLMALIIMGSRGAGATICRNWGIQAGFQTKMVVLNWSDSGHCLAKAPNGQWVPNSSVQQFLPGR